MDTILYPEGKRTSFTVVKRIVLARAIIDAPKLLILEDPLEHFEAEEASEIIDMLTSKSNPWALIVVSTNDTWSKRCSQVITLENGEII